MAVFAILLPVTTRSGAGAPYQTGGPGLEAVVQGIDAVAAAAARVGDGHSTTVTVGVDEADGALGGEVALEPFRRRGIPTTLIRFGPSLVGRLCGMWNMLAAAATGAHPPPTYYWLLGDDVRVTAPAAAWGAAIEGDFATAVAAGAPPDVGVVAAADTTFPGFPSFPVVHQSHLDAFCGRMLPVEYDDASQGGDPYLFELHSRVGAATFSATVTVTNGVGGNAEDPHAASPRYARAGPSRAAVSAALARGEATLRAHLAARGPPGRPPLPPVPRLDVVVPCWRCDVATLRRICTLRLPPRAAATTFIIIVDNPGHPRVPDVVGLERELWEARRVRVRVRVNATNRGVSASRNRGLRESSAPYVLFLDDDVVPAPDLLWAYAQALAAAEAGPAPRTNAHDGGRRDGHLRCPPPPSAGGTGAAVALPPCPLPPRCAAYAGVVAFPPATNAFTSALVCSHLLYFFGAPANGRAVPWGVTANLLLPTAILGDDPFDEGAPPGGGGEDILVCARLATTASAAWPLVAVPAAVVVHPWWEGGRRCYPHFWRWAWGDGRLANALPDHTYVAPPNAPEQLLAVGVAAPVVVAAAPTVWTGLAAVATAAATIVAVDVVLAAVEAAAVGRVAAADGRVRLGGGWATRAAAAAEAAVVLWTVDGGRLAGHASRGRLAAHLCRRFDWHLGTVPAARGRERRRQALLCGIVGASWVGLALLGRWVSG